MLKRLREKQSIMSSLEMILLVVIISAALYIGLATDNLLDKQEKVFRNSCNDADKIKAAGKIDTIQIDKEKANEALRRDIYSIIANRNERYSIFVKPLFDAKADEIVINSKRMPSASMIKIFIMGEAFRQKRDGRIDFSENVVLKRADIVDGAGSLQNHPEGTIFAFKEILDRMIIESDNTATNIVIDKIGMNRVNRFIENHGAADSCLQRKMMDFEAVKLGRDNDTSVTDIAVFFEKLYRKSLVDIESDNAMIEILKRQQDNDKIPRGLPRNVIVAHKTGELVGFVHDGGLVYTDKGDYVLCIMVENVSNPISVNEIIADISNKTYKHLIREK